jgi:hypothetical protein
VQVTNFRLLFGFNILFHIKIDGYTVVARRDVVHLHCVMSEFVVPDNLGFFFALA